MNNVTVRNAMALYGVKNYELADIIGTHPRNVINKLSKELPKYEQVQIAKAIKKVFYKRYCRR